MIAEPVILSWSGGKDSSLALHALRQDPGVEVIGLLTSVTRGFDRISIHGVRRSLLEAQARAVGLPLHEVTLEPQSSNDAYESAFRSALAALRKLHPAVRRIAFGDLYLEDVRAYREQLLASVSFEGLFPVWGRDTTALAHEFIDAGFRARLVCVDTTQLDAGFAGREFDRGLLAELPIGCDPCGEGGEFHTFVWDGPVLSFPVPVETGERVLRDGRFAYCDLVGAAADPGRARE